MRGLKAGMAGPQSQALRDLYQLSSGTQFWSGHEPYHHFPRLIDTTRSDDVVMSAESAPTEIIHDAAS